MNSIGLRIAAAGVAVVAVIDPSLVSSRASKPIVAIEASAGDRALADRVGDALQRRFTMVRGSSDVASATVFAGGLPDDGRALNGLAFGVVRRSATPDVRIRGVAAPREAPLHGRTPVDVHVRATGTGTGTEARGRSVRVELWAGEMRADHVTIPIRPDSSIAARLSLVALASPQRLRITAQFSGESVADSAFALVVGREQRLPILFFDGRPSWNSTFIRRKLADDPRFSVVHRVQTSRGLSNSGGSAPASLRDLESLRQFTVIVVGAPDLLTPGDVSGLESFMRRRGGRVVVLMDSSGSPAERLMGRPTWRNSRNTAPSNINNASGRVVMRARDLVWPSGLPSEAQVHASNTGRDSNSRAIVWSVPVGAGRMIVSSARDAWHFRGDSAGFDVFWLDMIADLALQAVAPVEIHLSRQVVAPGDEITARVSLRDIFLSGQARLTSRVAAMLVSESDSTPVRLIPDVTPGLFSARLVAPRRAGSYRLMVSAGSDAGEGSMVVDAGAVSSRVDDRAAVEAFVSSRGGRVIEDNELNSLSDLIAAAIQPVSRVESWHPMRSPWWILPFALLLGAEWWWRRRRGLA